MRIEFRAKNLRYRYYIITNNIFSEINYLLRLIYFKTKLEKFWVTVNELTIAQSLFFKNIFFVYLDTTSSSQDIIV